MGKSTFLSGLALALSTLVVNSAQADVVYTTNFNSPTYSDGAIIGQDGWVITGASVVNPINVANTGANGNVSLVNTGQDVRRAFTPQTAANLVSISITADVTVSSVQGTGDYFIHLGDNTDTIFHNRVWARPGSVAGTFQMAMSTSSGTPTVWGGDLNLGGTFLLESRYDVIAGTGNDTGQVFINNQFYVNANTLGTDATVFSSVNLRQGATANGPGVTIDNITVTTTAIPEPATGLLLGLGFAGMVIRRRK